MKNKNFNASAGLIRYAVVGLGHIAQNSILPSFLHAKNSRLTALVSDDPAKLGTLSRKYKVEHTFAYDDYETCLRSGVVDAVFIALPNDLHEDFCIRAAQAGIHVLCEKPLAVTEGECENIITACEKNKVKLMTAYRLHFQRANLEAVRLIRSGKIGEPRIFNSVFTMQLEKGNTRTRAAHAGGTLYDIGIYCINAARYLFGEEPLEGFCYSAANNDPRFRETEEMTSVLLRFPGQRLANFTTSFGAADSANFEILGTRGKLRGVQAYEYSVPAILELTVDGRTQKKTYGLRDQFAPELIYFSECIVKNREPEPSGMEGLRDVHIIRSLYQSEKTGRKVVFDKIKPGKRPTLRQEIYRPPVKKPAVVHAKAPSV